LSLKALGIQSQSAVRRKACMKVATK